MHSRNVVLVRGGIAFEILDVSRGSARDRKGRGFVGYGCQPVLWNSGQLVTQGDGVVVTEEYDIQLAVRWGFQRKAGFMEAVLCMVRSAKQDTDAPVRRTAVLPQDPDPSQEVTGFRGLQSEFAIGQQQLPLKCGRPGRPLIRTLPRHPD